MEEERLYDAKIAFDEDCKRFNDYMDNVQLKAGEAEKDRTAAQKKSEKMNEEIRNLMSQFNKVTSQIQ